jgi:hypothetical protein
MPSAPPKSKVGHPSLLDAVTPYMNSTIRRPRAAPRQRRRPPWRAKISRPQRQHARRENARFDTVLGTGEQGLCIAGQPSRSGEYAGLEATARPSSKLMQFCQGLLLQN